VHKVDPRGVQVWLEAAADLGLSVRSPYKFVEAEHAILCVALVEYFGSPLGTVVADLATIGDLNSEVERFSRFAIMRGLYPSVINIDAYYPYQRDLMIATLCDWGWRGTEGEAPDWYRPVEIGSGPHLQSVEKVPTLEDVLMHVLEEFAAFVDLAAGEDIRDEFAQWGRERLKSLLAPLADDDKYRLVEFLARERDLSDGYYQRWIATLAESLGLTSGS
jgi:hypothetical protein